MNPASQTAVPANHVPQAEGTTPQVDGPFLGTTQPRSPEDAPRAFPVIPGFEIEQELGRGGMGVVYRARQTGLNRIVALKMILHSGHSTPKDLVRFLSEAEAVAQIQHPNIVQIHQFGRTGDYPYFALEFIDGGTLQDRIRDNPLEPAEAARIVGLLARAMAASHAKGIIHRDLKPANVLMSRDGNPKIADFGLAKRLDAGDGLTGTGQVMGTPSYMSPEQARGDLARINASTDVYALGAILYALLTGRPPFVAPTSMAVLTELLNSDPVNPRTILPAIPRDLETICLKCLRKSPDARYRSADELDADLGRFGRGEAIQGRPIGWVERGRKWVTRHPLKFASSIFASLMILALSFLGLVIWQNHTLDTAVGAAIKREGETQAELRAKENLEQKRAEAQATLSEARIADREGKWDLLASLAGRTIAIVKSQPEMTADLEEAKVLQARAESEIRLAARLQASRIQFKEFNDTRDRVRFLASPFTKLDPKSQEDLIVQECRKGLKMFDLDPDRDPKLTVSEIFDEQQQREIREGCYELFLLTADSAATPHPGDTSEEKVARARGAITILKRASILQPTDASWVRRAAHYSNQAKDPLEAARIQFEGEKRAPETPFDHFLMGENYYLLGQWPEAKESLSKALRLRPDFFWSQYLLGTIAFQTRPQSFVEAKTYMNFCILQRQDFGPLYLIRCLSNAGLGLFSHAEEDFEKVLSLDPSPVMRYSILLNRSVIRQLQKNFDGAMADLQTALTLRPNEGILHEMIAQTEWQRNNPTEALAAIDRAIELQPKEGAFYATRANFRKATRNPSGALEDLTAAISLFPLSHPVGMNLRLQQANWLLKERKYDQTIAVCDDAVKLPDQSNEKKVEALTTKAVAYGETNRHRELLQTLEIASKLGWKPTASLLRSRGLAHARMGNYSEAIADLSVALQSNRSSTILTERGWIYVQAEAYRPALQDFEASIRSVELGAPILSRFVERLMRGSKTFWLLELSDEISTAFFTWLKGQKPSKNPSLGSALCGRGLCRILATNGEQTIDELVAAFEVAIEDISKSCDFAPDESRVLSSAARAYSVAASRIQNKGTGTDPALRKRLDHYREQAVKLLELALENLDPSERSTFWDELLKQKDATSFQSLPGFGTLEKKYFGPKS